jgi:hypothetical protein
VEKHESLSNTFMHRNDTDMELIVDLDYEAGQKTGTHSQWIVELSEARIYLQRNRALL